MNDLLDQYLGPSKTSPDHMELQMPDHVYEEMFGGSNESLNVFLKQVCIEYKLTVRSTDGRYHDGKLITFEKQKRNGSTIPPH